MTTRSPVTFWAQIALQVGTKARYEIGVLMSERPNVQVKLSLPLVRNMACGEVWLAVLTGGYLAIPTGPIQRAPRRR